MRRAAPATVGVSTGIRDLGDSPTSLSLLLLVVNALTGSTAALAFAAACIAALPYRGAAVAEAVRRGPDDLRGAAAGT